MFRFEREALRTSQKRELGVGGSRFKTQTLTA